MIVAESGKISNKVIHLKVPYTEENLHLLSKAMTYNYKGKSISQVLTDNIIENFHTDIAAMSGLAKDVMPNFMRTLEDMLNVNLYMEGLTNIFDIPEYSDLKKAKSFIEMLSQKEDFTRKLMERENGVIVTIGEENADDIMNDCATTCQHTMWTAKLVGKIGVIGPTRMRYGEVTSIIEYLTDNLSNTFKLESGGNEEDER